MGDNSGPAQLSVARGLLQPMETDGYYEKFGARGSVNVAASKADGFIALIESRVFIRECLQRSMQSAFTLQIRTFSKPVELQQKCHDTPTLILLSATEGSKEASAEDVRLLSQIAPRIPIIVLAFNSDAQMAKAAISHGAKGFIPVTLGFDIAIEAVRFVLAGGTYVPIDYLLTGTWPGDLLSEAPPALARVTDRELAVVRAIQQGKSNKVIAYELGMCESTVKVHVRRIMKKLNAKNRTDAAIKSQDVLSAFRTSAFLETPAYGSRASVASS